MLGLGKRNPGVFKSDRLVFVWSNLGKTIWNGAHGSSDQHLNQESLKHMLFLA